MAVTVTHATVAVGTDAGNGEIRKAQWNEAHTVTNAADVTASNTFTANQQVSVTGGQAYWQISGDAGQNRSVQLLTSGVNRWIMLANNVSESGSDAGSNFQLNRYDDSGTFLGTPIAINRSTGLTTMEALNVTGALRTGSKYVPYIFAQSGTAVSVGAVTTEVVLATISFAGGEIGPNGWVQVITQWVNNNNANAKTMYIRVGGTAGTLFHSIANSTSIGQARPLLIVNNNSQSSQKTVVPIANSGGFGGFAGSGVTSTVNTASAWDLVIAGQKAVSGDTLTLEGYQVLVCYGA